MNSARTCTAVSPATPSGVVVADGNSLTDQYFNPGFDWPGVVAAQLAPTPRLQFKNVAVSGRTTAELIVSAPALVDPFISIPGATHVVIAWEWSNEMRNNVGLPTLEANIQAYCAARRAAGFKVIVLSTIARNTVMGPDFDPVRHDFNTWLRANWATFADGLVDVGGDPRIGADGQQNDTTYFYDGVHLNTVGQRVVAEMVRPVLLPLLH